MRHRMNALSQRIGRTILLFVIGATLAGCPSGEEEPTTAANPGGTTPPPASNNPPVISGAPRSSVLVGNGYSFTPTASDPDNDSLTFSVQNKPSWAEFSTTTGALTGEPSQGNVGSYANISISVSDGELSNNLPGFAIEVIQATSNNSPVISGTPGASIEATRPYSFIPNASDPDNDPLTFSVQSKPVWAEFSTTTGALTGAPLLENVGTYTNIIISVSDGTLSSSLPAFAIEVTGQTSNSSPIISGTPETSVVVSTAYSFIPNASDPNGDPLTFSVQNKPVWAQFDAATGALTGTPSLGDVGNYANIVISVSDGSQSSSLPPFSVDVVQNANGSVTLSWTAPTQNEDGTPLTDLAAYKFYYGTTPGNYPNQVRVDNPGITTFVVENLVPTTYYFVATAINQAGVESQFSNEAIKQVF